ncbi:hypothetical protein niasHT_029031 [Heterodera trifolii]|uniref:Uncharacterized protein n=1 Tax=Heterodera trifolii TaxID=157864 RepID=A0ABD2K8J3_9BILA
MSRPFALLSSAILPLAAFLAFASAIPVKKNETASNAIVTQILEAFNKIQESQKRALKKNDETPPPQNETASIEQFNAIATQILEDLNKIQDLQKRALKKIDKTPPPQLPGFFTKTRKAIGAFLLRKIGVATTPSDDSNWEEYVKNAKKKVAESIDDCEVFKTIVKQFIVRYPALDQAGKDYLYKELIEVKQNQEKTLELAEYSDQITEALKKA